MEERYSGRRSYSLSTASLLNRLLGLDLFPPTLVYSKFGKIEKKKKTHPTTIIFRIPKSVFFSSIGGRNI